MVVVLIIIIIRSHKHTVRTERENVIFASRFNIYTLGVTR